MDDKRDPSQHPAEDQASHGAPKTPPATEKHPPGGPQGNRGASDPKSGYRIAGINDRLFSQKQRDLLEQMADQDPWDVAGNAYAQDNRPEIFRQLNPLVIPENARDWPEFWTVHVPRTPVAWKDVQVVHDFFLVHTDQLRSRTASEDAEGPAFADDASEADAVAKAQARDTARAQDKARMQKIWDDKQALTAARAHRQTVSFPSEAEAERYAQQVWREYWGQHLDKQLGGSRKAFERDAVIIPKRRVEFTLDAQDPAHQMQYALWQALHPNADAVLPFRLVDHDMPEDIVVTARNVSWLDYPAAQTPPPPAPSRIKEFEADGVTIQMDMGKRGPDSVRADYAEPNRSAWDAQRGVRTGSEPGAPSERPWQMVGALPDSRTGRPTTYVLGRLQADETWEYYHNGSGKIAAFDAANPARARRMAPGDLSIAVPPVPGRHSAALPMAPLQAEQLDRTQWTPEYEPPWEVRNIGPRTWALTRSLQGFEWEFYHNASGRVVAFDSKKAASVAAMVPHGTPVVVGSWQPGEPDADALRDLWEMARNTRQHVRPHPEVEQWLVAEQTLGQKIKAGLQEFPDFKQQAPAVIAAVADVHRVVFPPNGIVGSDPALLTAAHEHLTAVIVAGRMVAPGPVWEPLQKAAQFWHHQSQALSQDRLGLFSYNRVADLAFEDPDAAPVQRIDGTGDWIASRTPSGAFVLGQTDAHGAIQRVDLAVYRDERALRIRVGDQGGYLTLQNRKALLDAWEDRMHKSYGKQAAARIDEVMTPSRELRRQAFQAAQAADPKPATTERPAPALQLYCTPLGGGKGLVWTLPTDGRRKELEPEFVIWHGDKLAPLNKRAKGWLPPVAEGEAPRKWAEIPESKRPWVVESQAGLADMVQQIASRVPQAQVQAAPLPNNYLVRALAQRYGLMPEPLATAKEGLWTVHPTPQGGVMLSTRQWVAQPKADHPGEYEAYAAVKPFQVTKAGAEPEIRRWPSAAAAQADLERAQIVHRVSATMPPEVVDWFAPRLQKQTLAAPPVRWGPIEPLTALTKTANRLTREAFVEDLIEDQTQAGVPAPVQRMQRQIVAGARAGLKAADFEAILPDAARNAGVSWQDAERAAHDYARYWLAQRPKLAERITHPAPPAVVRPAPASSALAPSV
jgi:hypothetical protein